MSILDSLDTVIDDPARWACLNVVLALSDYFHHGIAQDPIENEETWGYFQNAFAVVGQLMTMHVTLWSVQALLGMALVVQGTPNQGPVSLLVSGAMKLAHRLGLHKQCQNPNISPSEIEERKRVFWMLYSLDKDLSLQMGQPSAQDDDDIDVDLPSDIDTDNIYSEDLIPLNYFNYRARLAMIQGQIYKRLYSAKATKLPVPERVSTARELEEMLQSWKATVPYELMECHKTSQVPNWTYRSHPIILQLLYYNSLAIVYNSLPAIPRYREIRGVGEPIEFKLVTAPLVRAAEARKAISLIAVTPQRKFACVW
jgi:hypothetical protein